MGTLKLNQEQAALEQGQREERAKQKAEAERTRLARENATKGSGCRGSRQCSPNTKKSGGRTGLTIRGGVSGKTSPRRSYWVQSD